MLLVGGDVDAVPRQQLDHPVFTLERGGPGEDHHPLVLGLVKPEAIGRPVPRADDPFDADAVARLENGGEFFGEVLGEVGEGSLRDTPRHQLVSPLMDLLKQQHFLKRLSLQVSTQSLDPVYRSVN